MFESIRRRFAMKSSLFCYAIEKKKLYILMFSASLHHTRNPTISVPKLSGRRSAMNQSHCAANAEAQIMFVCCCRAQPSVVQEELKGWLRDEWQNSSPETLVSWLHFLGPAGIYCSLLLPSSWTSGWQKSSAEAAYEKRSQPSINTSRYLKQK